MKAYELDKLGFIVKHLFGKWYLVRLYTHGFGKHIIFPWWIKE